MKDALLDLIAAHALACYSDTPADDDAHGLLHSYNTPSCWVQAAEDAGRDMADTRAACMAWHAVADDFLGFAPLEIAAAYADIADRIPGSRETVAYFVEEERDAWHAICARDRNTEDGEVFYAFDDLLEGLQS